MWPRSTRGETSLGGRQSAAATPSFFLPHVHIRRRRRFVSGETCIPMSGSMFSRDMPKEVLELPHLGGGGGESRTTGNMRPLYALHTQGIIEGQSALESRT